MKLWIPVSVIALGLSLIGYAVFLRSSDEDEILECLDTLAETVRLNESETNPVLRGVRINAAFADIFTKDVSVRIPDIAEIGSDRRDLAGAAAQVGGHYRTADVRFGSTNIAIDPSKTTAAVTTEATVSALRYDGQARMDTRGVTFRFDKVSGDWRIASIAVAPRNGNHRGEP